MKTVILTIILSLPLLFYPFNYENENIKTITVLDFETHEPLCGVYVNNEYTDFYGKVCVKEDFLDVYYISYETITCDVVDTLYLKQE
jgi:hypothetical protein